LIFPIGFLAKYQATNATTRKQSMIKPERQPVIDKIRRAAIFGKQPVDKDPVWNEQAEESDNEQEHNANPLVFIK
jgi:hypothetical protein